MKQDEGAFEQILRVLDLQMGDVKGDSEIPDRYAAASLSQIDSNLRTALDGVLASLPDVKAEITARVKTAVDDGRPAPEAQLTRGQLARFVGRARPEQLWLVGPMGVGKTYGLSAILNAARSKFIPGRLVSITSIIKDVRATFGFDREEKTSLLLHRYENVPLLALDDLDKMHVTAWSASFIFDLVNSRSERFLPTYTSSNLTPDKILASIPDATQKEQIGAALDRLRENARLVAVGGKSRR